LTEKLGNEISDDCFSLLSSLVPARKNFVILLLTVDNTGFSSVCLLSPFQVLSKNRSEIFFELHSNSHTKENLERTGKGVMVVPESAGLLYIKGEIRSVQEGSGQAGDKSRTLYHLKVLETLRDRSESAPINSLMTFDTSVIGPQYQRDFEEMRARLQSTRLA
jgi:hypothetical protein